jgi:hypothetical protein
MAHQWQQSLPRHSSVCSAWCGLGLCSAGSGAMKVLTTAGCELVGGHSSEGAELAAGGGDGQSAQDPFML